MTAPVALSPAASLPVKDGLPSAAEPDDVFASLLTALTTAIGMPWPPQHGPATHLAEPDPRALQAAASPAVSPVVAPATPAVSAVAPALAPVVQPGTAAVARGLAALAPLASSAVHGPSDPGAAPTTTDAVGAQGAWAAVTQRSALPEKALAAPGHVERTPVSSPGVAVRGQTPAAERAPRPEGLGHAAPRHDAPVPLPPTSETPPAMSAAALAPPTAQVQAADDAVVEPAASSHEVKPALVEAARGLRHEGGGRSTLVVRLDPPELGAVLIRLTVQDGRVDVQLRTPDLAARSDLQAQSYDVQQVLREQGFDLSSFDVQHGDVLSEEHQSAPDRGTREQQRRADGPPADPRVTDDVPTPEPAGTWL